MPLTRVSLRRGKRAAYRKALLDGIYRALRAVSTCLRTTVSW